MSLFENEKFTSFMFVLISVVSLLILFNFVNIFDDYGYGERVENDRGVTGLVVSDDDKNESDVRDVIRNEGELYSQKSYMIYYSIISILGFLIFLLSFRYFLPYLKDKT